MTKKSAGRLQRDAINKELASKNGWDDLIKLGRMLSESLTSANNKLVEALTQPGVLINAPKPKELAAAIRGLSSDVKIFHSELAGIHSMHANRTGAATDADDNVLIFSIFEKYVSYQTKYEATIIPTVTLITEQIGASIQAMQDSLNVQLATAAATDSATDPNVITDVIVKETKTIDPSADTPKDFGTMVKEIHEEVVAVAATTQPV